MRNEMLKNYLETMRFISQTSGEMMYLCDLAEQKIYFAENYAEKLQVAQIDGTEYSLSEMQDFLFARNGQRVSFKLSSFDNLEDGLLRQEYHLRDKEGKKYKIHSTEKLQYDKQGNPMWIIGRISTIATDPMVDGLTNLFNARKLLEDLTECVEKKKNGFLIVLGIDNFKYVNNKYGRKYGNRMLKDLAEILDRILDLSLRAYRLDSDKFAINAIGYGKDEVEGIYRQIQEEMEEKCTLSSGAVEYCTDAAQDANKIYQYGENALDLAKKNGKNKLEFFSEQVFEEILSSIDFQEELKESVENGFSGFSISYQPQYDMESCAIRGVEALLRYHSPKKGNVSPDEFIPVLEQTELIIDLGKWVLKNALFQCKKWRTSIPHLSVSVNISYVQLKNTEIWEEAIDLVRQLDLPGEALTLELTESIQLQDYRFFNKIFYKLRKHGIKVAIDDFGTGYSSLSYLKSIAINKIKIDRSFVSGIQYSAYNYRLLGNLIELAHSAQIQVCCEGVETESEFQTLKEIHPDEIQGYLLGKPYNVDEFEERYINEQNRKYQKIRQNEEKYRHIRAREESAEQDYAKNEKMAAIVDGMDEIVYVCDYDNYELMYLNAAGREMTGMYDYNGRKCYEVLQGRKTPCENCQKKHVGSDAYYVWEWENSYLSRHFLAKDKLIQWAGQLAYLSVCIDITEKEVMSKKVQERLEFEQNIVACTKILMEETDREKAIEGMLSLIGNYYDAKRAVMIGANEGENTWKNLYEWNVDGVSTKQDFINVIPASSGNNWKKMFKQKESLVIEDIEMVKAFAPNGYRLLKNSGISSLILSPIRKNMEVIGFIVVDSPKNHGKDYAQLETMAYLLADRFVKDGSFRDHLTGVFNRMAFETEVKKHVELYGDVKDSSLILLDLDNFKIINDKYGHMEGDKVLKQMAGVLKKVFRKYDLIGRLGGDEFLVFLKDLTDREIINRRLMQFKDAFSKVNLYESTCSMGITTVRKEGFSYEECLKKADVALYQSKEKGKNMYSYYEEEEEWQRK